MELGVPASQTLLCLRCFRQPPLTGEECLQEIICSLDRLS